jgi:ribosomal protein S18 acetylase RimI-like enzyme
MSVDAPIADATYSPAQPDALAAVGDTTFRLTAISAPDPMLDYCLKLAHQNMSPYLERRGECFNDERWRELAPQSEFYLICGQQPLSGEAIGFVSVRRDPDCPPALHIGDVQVEPAHQNRGAGTAALRSIEALARSRGLSEITLNVFRDNPALRLYERVGYRVIDNQFYKYKMRKALQP